VQERCAITCRAAPSFIRVGHLELWARRAARGESGSAAELRSLVEHALSREFGEVDSKLPFKEQLFGMMRAFARRQATLSVNWLRVGYVQGNMNSDNCLVSGRTMDYGPFGFLERYESLWSPFTSDMERKFGFERQPLASQVNLMTLARALIPLLERESDPETSLTQLQNIVSEEYPALLKQMLAEMYASKLGLHATHDPVTETLLPPLQDVLGKSGVDWTIFWRELSCITLAQATMAVEVGVAAAADGGTATSPAVLGATDPMLAHLTPAFFDGPPDGALRDEWRAWLSSYAQRLASEGRADSERQAAMRATSPKFIPREWVLAQAYTAAEKGDFAPLNELLTIFTSPFDEHSEEASKKYYRKPPTALEKKAGLAYFS